MFGDRLHLRLIPGAAVDGPDSALAGLSSALTASGVQVDILRVVPPSLEDVFIALHARRPDETSGLPFAGSLVPPEGAGRG